MNEPKPFASLSPSLLARKGGARPAMRPQLAPLPHFQGGAVAHQIEEDLGWNDMGDTVDTTETPIEAEILVLKRGNTASVHEFPAVHENPAISEVPAILRQQEEAAERMAKPARKRRERRSALSEGRRAAFTLRIDSERHLQLRLACTVANRSAQQLVTDALDRLISELPDVSVLAAKVSKSRN